LLFVDGGKGRHYYLHASFLFVIQHKNMIFRGYSIIDVLVFPIGITIRSLKTKFLSEKK